MKRISLLVGLIASVATAMSAQVTTTLSTSKANDYGLTYTLPLTGLNISLTAEGITRTPGEFFNYATQYLGSEAGRRTITKPSQVWNLTEAQISTQGVAQPNSEKYLVTFKSGSAVDMHLNEQGFPLALGSKLNPADFYTDPSTTTTTSTTPAAPSKNSAASLRAVTEEMVASTSLSKRAALAAQQIMELRRSRQDYLTGQAEQMPDGAALQLILKTIDEQEEALTAMFIGTETRRQAQIQLNYLPGNVALENEVIARLSNSNGFVDADDLSGAPIYLNLQVIERGQMPRDKKGSEKKLPKGGVVYCIPGSASATIDFKNKEYASAVFPMAQLGVNYALDPALFTDRKNPAGVTFNPTTGGILKLTSNSAEK